MSEDVAISIDPAEFRSVLGHFPTGIAVITAFSHGEPVGLAANSFTSVSLEPPLVLFCAAKTSATYPLIRDGGSFAANILADSQEEVSRAFAAKGVDRFDTVGFHTRATGSPILSDALAYLDCRIDAEHEAGDHVIVVGRVLELGVLQGGHPLVFFRGGYSKLHG